MIERAGADITASTPHGPRARRSSRAVVRGRRRGMRANGGGIDAGFHVGAGAGAGRVNVNANDIGNANRRCRIDLHGQAPRGAVQPLAGRLVGARESVRAARTPRRPEISSARQRSGLPSSLGVNLRERLETNDAPLFGIGSAQSDTYLIQRIEVHADAHLGQHWQFFVQLQDARAFGKNTVSPVDKNPLDLEQAFATHTGALGGGIVRSASAARRWRSTCSGSSPRATARNVRQAFDAVWAVYEYQKWRFIGYATQPVQNRNASDFDDVSNRDLTFSGVRFERQSVGPGDLSAIGRATTATTRGSRRERSRASRRGTCATRARWGLTGTSKRCCRPARSATRRSGRGPSVRSPATSSIRRGRRASRCRSTRRRATGIRTTAA